MWKQNSQKLKALCNITAMPKTEQQCQKQNSHANNTGNHIVQEIHWNQNLGFHDETDQARFTDISCQEA